MGGAEEGGGGIEDDAHGHRLHQQLHGGLVEEGLHEIAALQAGEHFGGDAAAEEDAAGGHHFEREIAGFGAVIGHEHVHGVDAAGVFAADAGGGDDGGGIAFGEGLGEVGGFIAALGVAKEL